MDSRKVVWPDVFSLREAKDKNAPVRPDVRWKDLAAESGTSEATAFAVENHRAAGHAGNIRKEVLGRKGAGKVSLPRAPALRCVFMVGRSVAHEQSSKVAVSGDRISNCHREAARLQNARQNH